MIQLDTVDTVVKSIHNNIMAVTEFGIRTIEDYLREELPKPEVREKAEEIRGESILDVKSTEIHRGVEIPDTLNVTSLRETRHRWSRSKGATLSKPADRIHYTVRDALRQLTTAEKGFRVSGKDSSGRRVDPITVFVDPTMESTRSRGIGAGGNHLVFSTMGDREARLNVRKNSTRRLGRQS